MQMTYRKIFIDMDGVLADFDGGVELHCGITPIAQDAKRPEDYDDKLWEAVRKVPHFYDILKPMPGATEMFHLIYSQYGADCEILTGIPKEKRGIVTAAEDKVAWMKRFLSEDVKVNTVLAKEKQLFCRSREDILIDDYSKNIRRWEEAGGTGIYHKSAEETVAVLKSMGALT